MLYGLTHSIDIFRALVVWQLQIDGFGHLRPTLGSLGVFHIVEQLLFVSHVLLFALLGLLLLFVEKLFQPPAALLLAFLFQRVLVVLLWEKMYRFFLEHLVDALFLFTDLARDLVLLLGRKGRAVVGDWSWSVGMIQRCAIVGYDLWEMLYCFGWLKNRTIPSRCGWSVVVGVSTIVGWWQFHPILTSSRPCLVLVFKMISL